MASKKGHDVILSCSHNDGSGKRTGRIRKAKQFPDYDVDLPHNSNLDNAEQKSNFVPVVANTIKSEDNVGKSVKIQHYKKEVSSKQELLETDRSGTHNEPKPETFRKVAPRIRKQKQFSDYDVDKPQSTKTQTAKSKVVENKDQKAVQNTKTTKDTPKKRNINYTRDTKAKRRKLAQHTETDKQSPNEVVLVEKEENEEKSLPKRNSNNLMDLSKVPVKSKKGDSQLMQRKEQDMPTIDDEGRVKEKSKSTVKTRKKKTVAESMCFEELSDLTGIPRKKPNLKFACETPNCSEVFSTTKEIMSHKKIAHKEFFRYLCSKCEKEFGSFDFYKSHLRMAHSNEDSVKFCMKNIKIIARDEAGSDCRDVLVCTKCCFRYVESDDPSHDCEPMKIWFYCPCCEYEACQWSKMAEHISDKHQGECLKLEDTDRPTNMNMLPKGPGWTGSVSSTMCEICYTKLDSMEDLEQHMNTKHGSHPYACGLCKKCYGRKVALKRHLAIHRKVDLICEVCKKEFYNKYRLKLHMLTHTEDRPHQCEKCGSRFREERDVQKHFFLKHVMNTKDPDKSTKKDRNPPRLRSTVCQFCGKTYSTQTALIKHLRIHKKLEMYKCPDCELTFNEILALKQHKLTHQTLDFSRIGGIKTLSSATLQEVYREIRIFEEDHHSGRPFRCGICDKRFKQLKAIHAHIRGIHMKAEDKSYVCHICRKGFALKASLLTHMRLHTYSKPYKCRLCEKQFRQLGHIKNHLLSHGRPQLQCALCGKMFSNRPNLKQHIQTHCKTLPYKCPVSGCSAAFHSLYPFLKHFSSCQERVDISKTLKCNFCQESFLKGDFISHYQNHEADVTFPCENCGELFQSYLNIYFHKEKKGHFMESEFETSSNKKGGNTGSVKSVEIFTDLDEEELTSQYDYIADSNEETVQSEKEALQENNNNLMIEVDSNKAYVDMCIQETNIDKENGSNQLRLLAEQLTYMADGLPTEEVVIQTTGGPEEEIITEITVQQDDEGNQELQNVIQTTGGPEEGTITEITEQQVDESNQELQNVVQTTGGSEEGAITEITEQQVDESNQELQNVVLDCLHPPVVSAVIDTTVDVIDRQTTESMSHLQDVEDDNGGFEVYCEMVEGDYGDDTQDPSLCSGQTLSEDAHKDSLPAVSYQTVDNIQSDNIDRMPSNALNTLLRSTVDSVQVSTIIKQHRNTAYDLIDKIGEARLNTEDKLCTIDGIELKLDCSVCKCTFQNVPAFEEHICNTVTCQANSETQEEQMNKIKGTDLEMRIENGGRNFKKQTYMSQHLIDLTKKGGIVYKCTTGKCLVEFVSMNKVALHKRIFHNEILKPFCKPCGKELGNFHFYKSHLLQRHNDKDSLPYLLRNVSICIQAKTEIFGEQILVCTKCGYQYGDLEDPGHVCNLVRRRFYCPCGEYKSQDLGDVRKHITDNHGIDLKETRMDGPSSRFTIDKPRQLNSEGALSFIARDESFQDNDDFKTKHAASPFACGVCKLDYGLKSSLICHLLTHNISNLKCDCCQKSFSCNSKLDAHMLLHTGDKPYQCEVCGNRFSDSRSLRKHIKIEHSDCFKSSLVEKTRTTYTKKRSSGREFVCHVCGKSFRSNANLKRHIMAKHKTEEQMFQCPVCEIRFNEFSAFKRHKLEHQTLTLSSKTRSISNPTVKEMVKKAKHPDEEHPSGLPYKCGFCDKRFRKLKSVQQHMRIIHTKEEDKQFVCDVCHRGFQRIAAFNTHMRLHNNSKPYKCRICHKQFRQKGHIQDHLLSHGSPWITCQLCKKMFNTRPNLRQHVMIHCKVLPYKCPVEECSAAFHSLYPLLKHSTECCKSIASNTTLKCKICSITFPSSEILSHLNIHDSDVKFSCQVCGLAFGNYTRLYFHKEEKQHFLESEFDIPTYAAEKAGVTDRLNKQVPYSDNKPDLSREELLQQYDYISGEDIHCINPTLLNTKPNDEEMNGEGLQLEQEVEVVQIIDYDLNQQPIIYVLCNE